MLDAVCHTCLIAVKYTLGAAIEHAGSCATAVRRRTLPLLPPYLVCLVRGTYLLQQRHSTYILRTGIHAIDRHQSLSLVSRFLP